MPVLSLHYRPPEEGSFNFAYYKDAHLALVNRIWGPFLTRVEVLQGALSLDPHGKIDFALITLLYFASDADLQSALTHPEAALLHQDIANFASSAPVVQINSVLHG